MSSSICDEYNSWHVSNMMFWRVMEFASEVGADMAATEAERAWVNRLSRLQETVGTYSPDLTVQEVFKTAEELSFWICVLYEVADRIYQRRIGNQDDQSWQTSTIWAVYDLAPLLEAHCQRSRTP